MKSLKDALAEADRKKVLDDVVALIDAEVGRKGGISGMALKSGYKVVKKLRGGRMVHSAANMLLDEFADAIEPIHQEYRDQDQVTSFATWLQQHEQRASNALLAITDKRAQRAEHRVLKSTYKRLRPQADKHVREALPGVGRLADRYCAD